jgi:hypothetical protein
VNCWLDTARGFQQMQGYMANNVDNKAHEQTYSGFTALLKWGTIVSFIVAMITVFIIAG